MRVSQLLALMAEYADNLPNDRAWGAKEVTRWAAGWILTHGNHQPGTARKAHPLGECHNLGCADEETKALWQLGGHHYPVKDAPFNPKLMTDDTPGHTAVNVEGGKYTWGVSPVGEIYCHRHGKPWFTAADLPSFPSKALIALIHHAATPNTSGDCGACEGVGRIHNCGK